MNQTKKEMQNRIDFLSKDSVNKIDLISNLKAEIKKLDDKIHIFESSQNGHGAEMRRMQDNFDVRTKELQIVSRIVNGPANSESKVQVIRDLMNSVPAPV